MSEDSQKGLHSLACRHKLQIGTCVSTLPLLGDRNYAETLTREFNLVTPENALKFGVISPARGRYDFAEADALVEFAESHGMEVRGHVLVWDLQLPYWLNEGKFSPGEMREILENHITTVVRRYVGRIAIWDVVNEAIGDDGTLRETRWYKAIGRDYLSIAFRAARAANPQALLFYNDHGIEATDRHFNGVCQLLQDLRAKGTPVDGVGLQMHLDIENTASIPHLAERLDRLAALGFRVHVTELDVRLKLGGEPTKEQLASQATVYRCVLRACIDGRSCDALVLWGFSDRHSWVPHFFPGYGGALIFDAEYKKKPSYEAIALELREESRVREIGGSATRHPYSDLGKKS